MLSLPESVKKTFRYGLIKSFISLPDKTQLAFKHHFATISLNRNGVFAIILLIFPKWGFRGLTIVRAKASRRFSLRLEINNVGAKTLFSLPLRWVLFSLYQQAQHKSKHGLAVITIMSLFKNSPAGLH